MLRNVLVWSILFTFIFVSFVNNASAVPLVLSHQGRLLDASDAPISGTFTVIYSIYDAPVGGTQLWLEDHVGVVVTDGLFSVELGSTVPLPSDIFDGSGGGGGGGSLRYLQVQLSGQPPISPRTPLLSVPSAMVSGGIYGETTSGAERARGIVGKKPGGGITGYMVALDADSDGDGTAETSVTSDCDPTSARHSLEKKGINAVKVKLARMISGSSSDPVAEDSLALDSDDDGVPDQSITSTIVPTHTRLAIKTKGTGADANRTASIASGTDVDSALIDISTDDDGDGIAEGHGIISVKSATGSGSMTNASSRLSCDPDEDGVPDSEISQSVTPTTCGVAIKTKGTGADPNRVLSIQNGATPDALSSVSSIDEDGDGLSESSISQHIAPTTSSLAIKTKGTSAQRTQTISGDCDDESSTISLDTDDDGDGTADAKVVLGSGASLLGGALPGGAVISARYDSDDDGVAEQEINQIVTPTTCSVAIKTRGTGADKNRVIGNSCDDSLIVNYLDMDDDGDGISEGRGIISVKSGTGSGSLSPRVESRLICDSDDDGVDDMTVTSSCDASQAKVVTDRDSGRSKARMGVTGTESSVAVEDDSDGDGLVDRSVSCSVDSALAQVLASEGVSEVSLRTRKGGIIKGSININHASLRQVEFDGDGNGYLSNAIGIGVDPTHKIDVVGGAYCDGTNWVNASDRNSKENFEKVDGGEILEKISDLEITKWNYKGDDDAQHIGPTAQDFKKTFGVGADDKSISTIDPSGIALAAIKELYKQFSEEMKQKDAQIEQLQKEMKKLRQELQQQKN